jgi:SAM-dependent methyltransferase
MDATSTIADASPRITGNAAKVQGGNRPLNYYDNTRPEIVALIPRHARRVLDVGCGKGYLGRLLRNRGHHVCGIELIPDVAQQAAAHLHQVVCGDVETCKLPWPAASFDVIVCGDVLEHLQDPWQTARRLASLLTPGGLFIASIPNVQNYRVIWNLIRGRWDYRERGILDHGHLRFFTWRGIEKLFEQAGLQTVSCGARWRPNVLRRVLCWATRGRAERFLARGYLVVGEKKHCFQLS